MMSTTTDSANSDASTVSSDTRVELNIHGYPIREQEPLCTFYVSSGGFCKFRSACRFHHPQEIAEKRAAKKALQEQKKLVNINSNNTGNVNNTADYHIRGELSNEEGGDKKVWKLENESVKLNSLGYPIRPKASICEYFAKGNGSSCKFQSRCRYNHPEELCRPSGKTEGTEIITDLDTETDKKLCFTFISTGTCKRMDTCPYRHSKSDEQDDTETGAVQLNSVGYPLREGVSPCLYYMNSNGHCTRRSKCQFDHPESVALERLQKKTEKEQKKKQLEEDANLAQNLAMTFELERNGERTGADNEGFQKVEKKSGRKKKQQNAFNSLGYPIREDMPECHQFANTAGYCYHGVQCRFSHPERIVELARKEGHNPKHVTSNAGDSKKLAIQKMVNDLGLPPNACYHLYLRGKCEQRDTCKFLHDVKPNKTSSEPSVSPEITKEEPEAETQIPELPPTSELDDFDLSGITFLISDVSSIANKLDLNDQAGKKILDAAEKSGARSKLVEVNLPVMANRLRLLGLSAGEIKSVCKEIFEMKKLVS